MTMPALGESVSEGTVTRWLKQEGDQVNADEPLLEVSTDKVDTEIPSPASGVLHQIVVGEDETVAVGAELGRVGGDGERRRLRQAEQQDQQPAEQQPAGRAGPAAGAAAPASEQEQQPGRPAPAPRSPHRRPL